MKHQPYDEHDRAEVMRLVPLACAEADVAWSTSALQLYRDARDVAEQRLPGPLGTAVAAVLAQEAYERSAQMHTGSLGARRTVLALAVAVLAIVPGDDATEPTRENGGPA